jgi:hypothetical protein
MIDPAHRLNHPGTDVTLVSQRATAQKSQSFTAALSDELGKRPLDARESPANSPLGQQNIIRQYSATANPTLPTAPADAPQEPASFDDSYWAEQPAAVQQLRNIQDPTQRAAVATQLAGEGYSVDVPIMVWGWDPQITTQARESMGYTWVPSALQQPVEVAPGMTFNGTSYNASNPPAGSIPV